MRYSVGYLLDAMARFAARRGDRDRAVLLLASASQQREVADVSVWGSQLARRDSLVDELRTALGSEAFDAQMAAGQRLTYDEALDAAAGLL
jgi:hypothetical protein